MQVCFLFLLYHIHVEVSFLISSNILCFQVLGESLYLSGKYLDYEEKHVVVQSEVESLSTENELLKEKVSSLSEEAKKSQDRLKTLEHDVKTKKAFC